MIEVAVVTGIPCATLLVAAFGKAPNIISFLRPARGSGVCDDADVRIRDLNNQISDCNNKISDCQTKFRSCQSNIDDIGKKISGCNGQIKDRQDEWNRFTSNDLQNRLIKIDQ